jgi:hypothetical protein
MLQFLSRFNESDEDTATLLSKLTFISVKVYTIVENDVNLHPNGATHLRLMEPLKHALFTPQTS